MSIQIPRGEICDLSTFLPLYSLTCFFGCMLKKSHLIILCVSLYFWSTPWSSCYLASRCSSLSENGFWFVWFYALSNITVFPYYGYSQYKNSSRTRKILKFLWYLIGALVWDFIVAGCPCHSVLCEMSRTAGP